EADDVDVVAVATPVEAHAEAVAAALRAGKPILCEKPLGVDSDEARELHELAADAGVTNAVGFNYRYVPAVALAKEHVDSGRCSTCPAVRPRRLKRPAARSAGRGGSASS